jgi:DNA-binding SARP family transcriptional activator/tetratricopeptide (TPR) repeat protein
MGLLELRLMGEFSVVLDGRPIDGLRSLRTQELLTYLVLHRDAPQARQRIAFLLWPESTEAQSRTNLRRELHTLRQELPGADELLRIEPTTIQWRPGTPPTVDLADFVDAADDARRADGDGETMRTSAERAVRAYGGDLLPASHTDWVLDARAELKQRCIELLDRLVAELEDRGAVVDAMNHARRRIALEPLEEAGYRALMRLQGRAGERAAALRTYHACEAVLERELGVAPSPETMAVYAELVADDGAAVVPALPRDTPLVGRDEEWGRLVAALKRSANGFGVVVVSGEAGTGKSRLAEELGRSARERGARVAHARCYATQSRIALGPVGEWLRSPAYRSVISALDAHAAAEVARLVPDLLSPDTGGSLQDSGPLSDAWQRLRLYEGVAHALVRSDQVVLVLDDLHWCDAETAEFVGFLARFDTDAPVLLVATVRPEELDDNAAAVAVLRELGRRGAVEDIELRPLDVHATGELVAHVVGDDVSSEALERLHRATGGFPLFLIEALRARAARGGTGLDAVAVSELTGSRSVLSGRLGSLGPAARQLADLAAVVGRDFSVELLTEASDLSEDEVVAAADELWRRRLVRERSATTYDFGHDLVRDTAYEEVSPPRRLLLHRRVAQAYELLHGGDLDPVADRIADHYEKAGQPARALPYHQRAAEAARRLFAVDASVRHFERALDLLSAVPESLDRDRLELHLRHSLSAPLNAKFGFASEQQDANLTRVRTLADRLGDTRRAAQSVFGLWAVHFVRGDIPRSQDLALEALDACARHPELLGEANLTLAGSVSSLGRFEEAVDLFERAADLASKYPATTVVLGFSTEVMARVWASHALWLAGRADEAVESARRGLEVARALADPYGETIAHCYHAILYQMLCEREASLEHARLGVALCHRHGITYYLQWAQVLEGWGIGGDEGVALIRRALEELTHQGAFTRRPYFLSVLAETLIDAGRAVDADAVLSAARSSAADRHDVWWEAETLRLQGTIARGTEAERGLRTAVDFATGRSPMLALRAATSLACHLRAEGRVDEARTVLEPARGAVTQGTGTRDLQDADTLLADLTGLPA